MPFQDMQYCGICTHTLQNVEHIYIKRLHIYNLNLLYFVTIQLRAVKVFILLPHTLVLT